MDSYGHLASILWRIRVARRCGRRLTQRYHRRHMVQTATLSTRNLWLKTMSRSLILVSLTWWCKGIVRFSPSSTQLSKEVGEPNEWACKLRRVCSTNWASCCGNGTTSSLCSSWRSSAASGSRSCRGQRPGESRVILGWWEPKALVDAGDRKETDGLLGDWYMVAKRSFDDTG